MKDGRNRGRRDLPADTSEGVRIIGSDEAADVLGRGEAQGRLGAGEARRGDRPVTPPAEGPPPALRFPLDSSADLDRYSRPPAASVGKPPQPASDLSHWAESAPEEVPSMSPQDPYEGDEASAWSAFAGAGPRWRDDDPPPGGPPPGRGRRPSQQGEPMVFDDYPDPVAGSSVFPGDPAGGPAGGPPYGAGGAGRGPQGPNVYPSGYDDHRYGDSPYDDEVGGTAYDTTYDDDYEDVAPVEPEPARDQPPQAARARPKVRSQGPSGPGGDRDVRKAVIVGVGMVAGALFLFQIDPLAVLVLVVGLLCLASMEYFTETHKAGFDPLMPVGVVATVAMPVAAFYYGERALPLVLVLSVVVCLVWYLVGAGGERPMANVGATLLGICWIGLLGGYAGLLLGAPLNPEALLVAAVIPTVGYDVGAWFVGRSTGSRPLSAASPNKTLEGLAGGMVLAVVAGVLLGVVGPHPFDFTDGLLIGLVAAGAAPLGDLSQSLLKRDLGIKDMGSVLPGHGGVLDRFDGLLFVLPAIWYLAVVRDGFVA